MIKITEEVKEKLITKFPEKIDERIYFQDINISQASIMKDYYKYITNGLYSKASELLNNSDVFFYGASLLNMFEDRLYIIGDYISKIEKPKVFIYGTDEPSGNKLLDNMNWIDLDTNEISEIDPISKLWHWDGGILLDGSQIFL